MPTCTPRSAALLEVVEDAGIRGGLAGRAKNGLRTAHRSRSASLRCAYAHLKMQCLIPDEKPRTLSSRSALLAFRETPLYSYVLPDFGPWEGYFEFLEDLLFIDRPSWFASLIRHSGPGLGWWKYTSFELTSPIVDRTLKFPQGIKITSRFINSQPREFYPLATDDLVGRWQAILGCNHVRNTSKSAGRMPCVKFFQDAPQRLAVRNPI